MYVYMYMYIYICIYIYMCVCYNVCECIGGYLCMGHYFSNEPEWSGLRLGFCSYFFYSSLKTQTDQI